MTAVVLRCPVCGTTQTNVGECEACSEGTVGYFCGNHSPGRWLAGPQCDDCGAKVGEPPPMSPPSATTVDAGRRRRISVPRRRTPGDSDAAISVRHTPTGEVGDADVDTPEASLAEVLVDMLEEGERRHRDRDDVRWREPGPPRAGAPVRGMGCLGRLVLLLVVLVALAAAGILSLVAGLAF